MIWTGIVASAVLALIMLLQRRQTAEVQSLIVGGRIGTGCVTAQAGFFLLLAVIGVLAWLAGWA